MKSNAAQARDMALDLFEWAQPDYLSKARETARQICLERGSVTVDDIRKVLPPPKHIDGRIMGSLLRAPEFEKISYENSDRRTCHARPIARFRVRT